MLGLPGLLLRWSEDGLGFGEEVELVLARDADVPGESKPDGEAGQLVVCGVVDRGQQHLFRTAAVVRCLGGKVLGQIVGEGVGVEVDDGT